MTSSINYTNIDATFPVAGQDNSSQGFRDNFQNIKTNFQYAYNEISALQANAVQAGQTNNMSGSVLANATVSGLREVIFDHGTVTSGTLTYNFFAGSYQVVNLGASLTVAFSNFSTITDSAITIRLGVVVPNVAYTVTWPASVSQNISTIDRQLGQITRFANTGYYIFQLTTYNGGTTWSITELTRNTNEFQGNVNFYTTISNATATGVTISVANVGGVVQGNIYANNVIVDTLISSGNSATYTGNVTANNLIANTGIYGTIRTATQSNITLLGTLTSLSVSGNANVGNITVTGMTDMCGGTTYGVQVANAANGGSTQIQSNIGFALLRTGAGVGTIATHTVIMPATPMNGQAIQIAFANTITALTQSGSGSQTVNGAFTTGNTSFGATWIYESGTNAWYRVG
jgi:hypothetical protein